MPKRMIYLAYPIDNARLSETLVKEINGAKATLHEEHGVLVTYDPGDAFSVLPSSQAGPEISMVNYAAIDASEAVLAWLPMGVASIGVPMEIAHAGMAGKPVAVLSDSYSWALRVPRDNVRVFPESQLEAAMQWLVGFEQRSSVFGTEVMPVLLQEGGQLPTRAHQDDAGLDLYVVEDTELPYGQFVDVACGVNVELPDWSWGLLTGRSSTFRKRGIEVQTGIIDAGYRGPLYAACIWRPIDPLALGGVDKDTLLVRKGERLAQLIIIPNGTRDVEPAPAAGLKPHARGESGFGSSGA